MKFAVVIASLLALGLTLVKGGTLSVGHSLRNNNQGTCDNPQVLQNTTIGDYDGYPIGFVATYCPQYCQDQHHARTDDHHHKNSQDGCYLTCTNLVDYPIYPDDCAYVFGYLESLIPDSFTIPPETYYEWYYGSCAVVYWNLDCCEYEVCYEDLAADAESSAATCLDTTYGAVCEGSGKQGDNFLIAIA